MPLRLSRLKFGWEEAVRLAGPPWEVNHVSKVFPHRPNMKPINAQFPFLDCEALFGLFSDVISFMGRDPTLNYVHSASNRIPLSSRLQDVTVEEVCCGSLFRALGSLCRLAAADVRRFGYCGYCTESCVIIQPLDRVLVCPSILECYCGSDLIMLHFLLASRHSSKVLSSRRMFVLLLTRNLPENAVRKIRRS